MKHRDCCPLAKRTEGGNVGASGVEASGGPASVFFNEIETSCAVSTTLGRGESTRSMEAGTLAGTNFRRAAPCGYGHKRSVSIRPTCAGGDRYLRPERAVVPGRGAAPSFSQPAALVDVKRVRSERARPPLVIGAFNFVY